MKKAIIFRARSGDQGTEGVFMTLGFWCYVMELPWRDNRRSRSRIPAGVYRCRLVKTPRHGVVFMVFGVPDRSAILLHSGCIAGDVEKGYKTHSEGCLLPGKYRGTYMGQRAVLVSKLTVAALMKTMGTEGFELEIRDPEKEGA